jgi:hypothetical protein
MIFRIIVLSFWLLWGSHAHFKFWLAIYSAKVTPVMRLQHDGSTGQARRQHQYQQMPSQYDPNDQLLLNMSYSDFAALSGIRIVFLECRSSIGFHDFPSLAKGSTIFCSEFIHSFGDHILFSLSPVICAVQFLHNLPEATTKNKKDIHI